MPKFIYEQEIEHYWRKILLEEKIAIYENQIMISKEGEHNFVAKNINGYKNGLSHSELYVIQINSCIDYLRNAEKEKRKYLTKKTHSTPFWVSYLTASYGLPITQGAFIFSCIYLKLPWKIQDNKFFLLVSPNYKFYGATREYVVCMNQYYRRLVVLNNSLINFLEVNDNV